MAVIIDGTTGIDTIEPTIVPAALNASGSAPLYAARAWVNFNGTGTVAIRASGNVSSITDNGVGLYTVNFTNAMPNVNYGVCGMAAPGNGRFLSEFAGGTLNTGNAFSNRTTSSVRVVFHAGSVVYDSDTVSIMVFR